MLLVTIYWILEYPTHFLFRHVLLSDKTETQVEAPLLSVNFVSDLTFVLLIVRCYFMLGTTMTRPIYVLGTTMLGYLCVCDVYTCVSLPVKRAANWSLSLLSHLSTLPATPDLYRYQTMDEEKPGPAHYNPTIGPGWGGAGRESPGMAALREPIYKGEFVITRGKETSLSL